MQTWTDNCFQGDHQAQTNLQAFEDNFQCLKTAFSGDTAPSSPSQGQWWFDTNSNILKIRNEANDAWILVFNFATNVLMLTLADGVLSADAGGRAKMADLFVTNAKINDVDGSKIADNSIASGKVQNNAVTPSKIAAGGATLLAWEPYTEGTNAIDLTNFNNHGILLSPGANNLATDSSTYRTFAKFYLYIPTGAKYVILGARASAGNYHAYIRVKVGSTTGSAATITGNGGELSANGSALDISSEAGAWKLVELQAVGGGGTVTLLIHSVNVQWYGA